MFNKKTTKFHTNKTTPNHWSKLTD